MSTRLHQQLLCIICAEVKQPAAIAVMTLPYQLRKADHADMARVVALIQRARLPTSDISTSPITFTVCTHEADIVGVVGLEIHGDVALLRSLAVLPEWRSRGVGTLLVRSAVTQAQQLGVREIWLLTTTAAAFFQKHGFTQHSRTEAPASIRATSEFATICPASAACMRLNIEREPRERPLKILFLCTGNSCRSQMAEGWARHLKPDALEAYSAGTHPKGIDPIAAEVMAECGVLLNQQSSKHVNDLLHVPFEYVVTVCDSASEHCPVFPGKAKVVHHAFDDPPALAMHVTSLEEKKNIYRRVRDEIRTFIESLPDSLVDCKA